MVITFLLSLSSVSANDGVKITGVKLPRLPEVSQTSALYFVIDNNTDSALTLVGVSTPVARYAMIHRSVEVNGIVKMEHLDSLVVPARGRLEFLPGGYHIMMMGLDKKLMKREFSVSLNFLKHSAKTFKVQPSSTSQLQE